MQPVFSILILTKTLSLMDECVDAIFKNTKIHNFEIIILNNSGEYIFPKSSRVTVIAHDNSGTFSSMNNMLAKRARGEYLVFCNDDVIVGEEAIDRLVYTLEKDKSIGMTGGLLLYPDGRVQSCGTVYHDGNPGHIHRGRFNTEIAEYLSVNREYKSITGALTAISRKDFIDIGMFDEDYDYCFEDCDLNLKVIHRLHKKIMYVAKSYSVHLESRTRTNSIIPGLYIFKNKWRKVFSNTKTEIGFVVCSNNEKVLRECLYRAPFITNNIHTVIDPESAAKGLNDGIKASKESIIVCCHQDVILPLDFIDRLTEKLLMYPDFGVMGVAGRAANFDPAGGCILADGTPYCERKEAEVLVLDECLLIIRRDSGLMFNEELTGFHCYGADICLRSALKGLKNYALDISVRHMSQTGTAGPGYWQAMAYIKERYAKEFPRIGFTHGVITEKEIISHI